MKVSVLGSILAAAVVCGAPSTATADVLVDEMTCSDETAGSGSDEVYVVAFRGNTTAPFQSNVRMHGPGTYWDDFDHGETQTRDVSIAQSGEDRAIVVMLVEEDNARDLSSSKVKSAWRTAADVVWKAQMLSVFAATLGAPPTEAHTREAATAVGEAMEGLSLFLMSFPIGNDDLIGRPQQVVVDSGSIATQEFVGDGGRYRVRFKIG